MGKFLFMKPVIEYISRGDFFKKAFALFLRVLAAVIALAGVVAWVKVWKSLSGADVATVLGIIIFQFLVIVALYMVVHVFFIRAKDVAELPDGDYPVISIASVFFKLFGEAYAAFSAVISLAGGILICFIGRKAFGIIKQVTIFKHGFGAGTDFLGGLVFIIGGIMTAFFALAIFYFLSEAVVVLADIARNTKKGK
ncbi:MAG TPA: hypothetical protein ENN23_09425 [Deltaproteobacteria bacterium]|nr:hypothetical protein [Deltaproteobacteria bacterium]